MQKTLGEIQTKISLKTIPGVRRHIYVYLLLALGAHVLSDVWRSVNRGEIEATQEIVRIQRIPAQSAAFASIP